MLSANNIGNGVEKAFSKREKEVKYDEKLILAPLTFLDDIGRLSENRDTTQYGNDKLEELINQKNLKFNFEKSNYMIIGSKRLRKKIAHEIREKPLTLCGKTMQEEKSIKYLGEILSSNLTESIHQAVSRRVGIA